MSKDKFLRKRSGIAAIVLAVAALLIFVLPSHVKANESVGYTYPDITITPASPSYSHEGRLDEYSRGGATVTFVAPITNVNQLDGCRQPGITCRNLVSGTARMRLICQGVGQANTSGGWATSPVFSGSCGGSLEACFYSGTINEHCDDITISTSPSLNINHSFSPYTKCTPALYDNGNNTKATCFHENSAPAFTTNTNDDMFKLRENGSAFIEYQRYPGNLNTPYRLTWVQRTGGTTNRGLMMPTGPFSGFEDFENFIDNPPVNAGTPPVTVTTAKNVCYPVQAELCSGDFTAYAPPQDGQCGSYHGTYMTSAPPNNTPETVTTKCLKGMDTPVTTNTSVEPNVYSWSCTGLDGGVDAACVAFKPFNGQCGSAAGTSSYGQPTQNLCAKGTATAVSQNSGTNTWTWTCQGQPGAPLSSDASCSSNIIVDGSCGTAQGGEYTSTPPTAELCSAGNNGAVTSNTCGFTWTCNGINGGLPMNCQANKVQSCDPVAVYANWRYFGTTSNLSIYSGPGQRMRNNCATGYTPTELGDDADSSHSLSEDNYKGGDRSQLCIGTSNANVSVTSEWVVGSCSAGMQFTGVYDSSTSGSDPTSKYWNYKHNVNEEDNTSNQYRWCLGLGGPDKDKYDLTVSQVSASSCGGSGTLLVNASGTEWNLNNEDGSINRSVCARITPKAGSTCSTCGGACGTANGVARSTPPSGGSLCAAGSTASSVTSASDSYIWTCSASGVTANCSAPKIMNGVCGPADGVPAATIPVDELCTVGDDTPVTQSGSQYVWSCVGLNGGTSDSCSAPIPACAAVQPGQCGPANGGTYANATATNSAGLCSVGSATAVSGSGPWSWVCGGVNGGANSPTCNASQSAPPGACGAAHGNQYATASAVNTAGLCSSGTAPAVSGSGPWSWTCSGSPTASCSATVAPSCPNGPTGSAVNGTCGSAHGGTYADASAVNAAQRCVTGTATSASLSGSTFSWSCNGVSGGTADSCSATQSAPPPSGQCVMPNNSYYAGGQTASMAKAGCTNGYTSGELGFTYVIWDGNEPFGSFVVCHSNSGIAMQVCDGGTNGTLAWDGQSVCNVATQCPYNGMCGPDEGVAYYDCNMGPTNLCENGGPYTNYGSSPGSYSWTCVGTGPYAGVQNNCFASRSGCMTSGPPPLIP